ncbi:MAG: M23 family metallopeptidase [bacterium]
MFLPVIKAEAGLLSSFSEFITGSKSEAATLALAEPAYNSQNMALLQAAINTDPNPNKGTTDTIIVDGDSLMSEAGPMGTIADIEEPTTEQISTYTVKSGDTLAGVADMFGVSANTIRWANDLPKNPKLKEGDILVILPINGIKVTVRKGDTLVGIAKKYKGDADEIARYNGIDNGSLVAGDTIVIPDGELAASSNTTKPGNKPVNNNRPSYSGYYMRPLKGGSRTQGVHGHNGVDLQTYGGDNVYAAASGKIIVAKNGGYNGGYGSYVVISHSNGTQTLYGHLSGVNVSQGQRVDQGQTIGYEGSTGRSTGTHLHFEVRGAVNPF